MRLVLKLKAIKEREFIYNYNSVVAEEISKLFGFDSAEIKEFLSGKQYRYADKPFKLFTFALHFENVLHRANKLVLRSNNAYLYISFSLIDDFVKEKVLDSLPGKVIEFTGRFPVASFSIQSVEIIPEPAFKPQMIFTLRSPVIISSRKKIKNIPTNIFLTYRDNSSEISRIITDDLVRKFGVINNSDFPNGSVKVEWDRKFIEEKLNEKKKLTAKLTIELNHRRNMVIGNIVPFRLTGNIELLKVGYDIGFGFYNSFGFGLVEHDPLEE